MARTPAIFDRVSRGAARLPGVSVRGAGCLIGLESRLGAKALRDRLLERGVLVGTSAHASTARLLPPYVLSDDEIGFFLQALEEALP